MRPTGWATPPTRSAAAPCRRRSTSASSPRPSGLQRGVCASFLVGNRSDCVPVALGEAEAAVSARTRPPAATGRGGRRAGRGRSHLRRPRSMDDWRPLASFPRYRSTRAASPSGRVDDAGFRRLAARPRVDRGPPAPRPGRRRTRSSCRRRRPGSTGSFFRSSIEPFVSPGICTSIVSPESTMSGSPTPNASTRLRMLDSACSITSRGVPSGADRITETPPSRSRPSVGLQRTGREAQQRGDDEHADQDDRGPEAAGSLHASSAPFTTSRKRASSISAAWRHSCMRPRKISKYSITWLIWVSMVSSRLTVRASESTRRNDCSTA